ncbi:T6SS amidase immunity protein Tai4 family protein [Erwinia sorbitola]|uniref:Type VI secretion protein n=1 Tax=Erwinia sorbitola TaxID=2681984 RepID=A0ABW9REN1_9GAMM|nr:T6SS amidase immunity protein Tai4 family protein [Erwinia sorbitola]MTD27975.1 hypothetical protein [Erwinia sorbitola]
MNYKTITLILLLSVPAIAKDRNDTVMQDNNLENFALSICLAKGFTDSAVKEDAFSASGAYVEQGSYPAEAYEEADELAKKFLAKKYHSKEGTSELIVMKCIDLSRSNELQEIKNKYEHLAVETALP